MSAARSGSTQRFNRSTPRGVSEAGFLHDDLLGAGDRFLGGGIAAEAFSISALARLSTLAQPANFSGPTLYFS